MTDGRKGPIPRPGAFAIVHGEEPSFFLAEDAAVISRGLALHLVARTDPEDITTPGRLRAIRTALLEERWADALAEWIDETGRPVDVFEEIPPVWTTAELDADMAPLEIRMAPVFRDPDPGSA